MPRGGNQPPKAPAPVSGPGRFSQRTDGKQPVASPGLKDPSVQYGDRQKLEAGQRLAPIPDNRSPRPSPALTGGRRRLEGEARGGSPLPRFLTQLPTARPGEPITTGIDMGPGQGVDALQASDAGEDIREITLEYLARTYGNRDAIEMLSQIRAERAAAAVPAPGTPAPIGGGLPSTPELPVEETGMPPEPAAPEAGLTQTVPTESAPQDSQRATPGTANVSESAGSESSDSQPEQEPPA